MALEMNAWSAYSTCFTIVQPPWINWDTAGYAVLKDTNGRIFVMNLQKKRTNVACVIGRGVFASAATSNDLRGDGQFECLGWKTTEHGTNECDGSPRVTCSSLSSSSPSPDEQKAIAHLPKLHDCFGCDDAFPERHRFKRYSIEGSFWGVSEITWRLARSSRTMPEAEVRRVMRRAFKVWEESTRLRFVYQPQGAAHIEIKFVEGNHGDGEDFDGRGKILAHAFFPRFGGEIHFDDAENWSPDKYGMGIDLYAVAVHEIGHALGLKHSSDRLAVMAPFYQTYRGEALHLHGDDLKAIDRLYGMPRGRNIGGLVAREKLPDICRHSQLDGITRTANGTIYAFQGDYFWELKNGGGIVSGPNRIDEYFPFEGHIDASVTDTSGDTYIFKGTKYWLLGKDSRARPGYPRLIVDGLTDTPDNLDAALVWHGDDKPYFFKGNKYWRYSIGGMPKGYPRSLKTLSRVHGLEKIDAALRYSDHASYVFAGQHYYKLGGKRYLRLVPTRPRSIANDWFGCSDESHPEH